MLVIRISFKFRGDPGQNDLPRNLQAPPSLSSVQGPRIIKTQQVSFQIIQGFSENWHFLKRNKCSLPCRQTARTFKVSFLLFFPVGDTHSLSDPLQNLNSVYKEQHLNELGLRQKFAPIIC